MSSRPARWAPGGGCAPEVALDTAAGGAPPCERGLEDKRVQAAVGAGGADVDAQLGSRFRFGHRGPLVRMRAHLAHCMYLQQQSLSLVAMARYALIIFHTTRASPTLDRRRDSLVGSHQPGYDTDDRGEIDEPRGPQSPALSRTLTQATTAAPHCSLSGRRRRLGVLNLLHLDLLAHELVHVDHYALLLHIHEDE